MLIQIATAAAVSVEWLATGKGARPRTLLDLQLLKWSIEAVEEGLKELELEGASAETRTEMIASNYETFRKDRKKPERGAVVKIIRAAA